MFQDYFAFLKIGNDWWAGSYSGMYPLPTVGVFAALTLIPWEVGYFGLATLGLFSLLVRLKRATPIWVAYIPVLQVILVGNLDLVWWGLWTTRLPIAYALMTLKPHLMLFAIPEMIRWTRRQKLTWLGWTAALWLPGFLVRPGWVGEWIRTLTHFERITQNLSSDLWNAPVWILAGGLLSIPLVWWITKRRPSFRPMALFLNPGINSYDYALLTGNAHWIVIPAAVIAQIAERYYNAHWAWGVVGLLATLATRSSASGPGRSEPGIISFWKKKPAVSPSTTGSTISDHPDGSQAGTPQ